MIRTSESNCGETAVYRMVTGQRLTELQFKIAAHFLGQPVFVRNAIVFAFDKRSYNLSEIRSDIEEATGLAWDAAFAALTAEASPSGIAGELAPPDQPTEDREPAAVTIAG